MRRAILVAVLISATAADGAPIDPGRVNAPPPGFFLFLPLSLIAIWLFVVAILSLMSGWLDLMSRFPDRPEAALARLDFQSGMMGAGVRMGGILTLTACPSGLRVAIWRLFGPFCRPFFVPWREITAEPFTLLLTPMIRLRFGNPPVGVLSLRARIWERLSEAARREVGAQVPPSYPVSEGRLVQAAVVQWGALTAFAAALFYFGPRLLAPGAAHPPLAMCIGFPAVVFGVGQLLQYLRHSRTG
ncbi:MAG TPA: hypothetical protein VK801_09310 [Caulobacteraceae bacterium]|jgi:hypothetical protein|nr:hypothetical protein [Caulobacteraceae bacterium]